MHWKIWLKAIKLNTVAMVQRAVYWARWVCDWNQKINKIRPPMQNHSLKRQWFNHFCSHYITILFWEHLKGTICIFHFIIFDVRINVHTLYFDKFDICLKFCTCLFVFFFHYCCCHVWSNTHRSVIARSEIWFFFIVVFSSTSITNSAQ